MAQTEMASAAARKPPTATTAATAGADHGTRRWLVNVEGLSIGFAGANGGRPLVRGVDLRIAAGECVALVGESGSGKSVTARSLLGLAGEGARIHARRFDIDGRAALTFSAREWRALRGTFAGLVVQDALVSLDPLRRIGAEVGEVLAQHRLRRTRADRVARVLDVMRDVGIPEPARRARQYAHELSGGLRQRALIASAIAAAPALIIADEPTTALDASVQAQVLAVLRERLEQGAGLLLISHDLGMVAGMADRVLVMHRGEVVDDGNTRDVLRAPSHPYTRQLIAARPSAHSRGHRLSSARLVPGRDAAAGLVQVIREPLPARPATRGEVVLQVRGLVKRYAGTLQGGDAPTSGRRDGFTPSARFDADADADGENADAGASIAGCRSGLALDDVSFAIQQGEVLGIVGESGSGKTTCGNIVLGLLAPDAGDVTFLDEPWAGGGATEGARHARRPRLQYIPQDPLSSFDPRHTVAELLAQSLHCHRLDARQRRERSVDLLEQVGLDAAFLARRPETLSGGQRQRIAIARAIAPEPALIVCDEPVSALDVYVQAQVLDVLAVLQARLKMSLLFISHDLGVIRHVSDRVLVFRDGRIVESGETGTVFDAPRHAYTRTLLADTPAW
ncbi:ABC transporter ATP-binding protein [Robbsia sp. Bb-Pol-6]|uniref:ABC transporter ATP-binding protein n=1 Tax=Robbsia betulipollinis TaxID=2981849 RepID=A0ABT3ZJD0_9BURK|nr:ABC transporter ATP-binding protein [Robbsia betulipollinis]